MLKKAALLAALVLSMTTLFGCGPSSIEEVEGTVYECTQFSALCPEGWSNYPVTELNDDTALSMNYLRFYKAEPEEGDNASTLLYSNAYINIGHYTPDTEVYISKDIYKEVEDVEIEVAGKKWKGYTGVLAGIKKAEMWVDGTGEWQVSICLSDEDGDIEIDDMELQAILASLKKK